MDMTILLLALGVSLVFSLLEFKGLTAATRKIFFGISSLLLFVLMGLNRMNPDYEGYQGSFYQGNDGHEIGYQILNRMVRSVGLPFETLIALMAVLLLAVLWLGLRGHTSNWVIVFYAIFPLALDLPQMRNTFMYLIVTLAVLLFANRSRIAYLASVLLATSMHMIGALYLPLAFLFKTSRKTFFKWIGVFALALFAGAVGLRIANLKWVLHPEIVEEIRPYGYFLFAVQALEILIDLFTYWWVDRKLKNKVAPDIQGRLESLYRFGWYSALYLPLLIVHGQMYRIRRNAQLVKYIYSGLALKYLDRRDQLILIGLVLLNLALVVFFMIQAKDQGVYFWFDSNLLVDSIKRLIP